MLHQVTGVLSCGAPNRDLQAASMLYQNALARGRRGELLSVLTGRSYCLLDLASVAADCTVHGRHDAGLQTVPIAKIRGSEGRPGDFDRDFRPLQEHTRARWLRVAAAWHQGKALPPVELLQVGDIYFVRDGHHRISVARALGQKAIEATVQVWQVNKPLTWERRSGAPSRGRGRHQEKPRTADRGSRPVSIAGWLWSAVSGAVSGILRPADGAGASPVGS